LPEGKSGDLAKNMVFAKINATVEKGVVGTSAPGTRVFQDHYLVTTAYPSNIHRSKLQQAAYSKQNESMWHKAEHALTVVVRTDNTQTSADLTHVK
jgi:hypothetical protein